MRTALTNIAGTKESGLRAAIEKCQQDATKRQQGLVAAKNHYTATSAAVRVENERLLAAAADGELIGLDTLRKLETEERDAAHLEKFAQAAVDGANARLVASRTKLQAFLAEAAKREESDCMLHFARIVTEELKPALAAIVEARRAREALGLREWVALPNIEGLLAMAAEMTRPAPAAPAPVDPLRIVTFTVGASVRRSAFGNVTYMAGEKASFAPALAARLVFENKAAWAYPGLAEQAALVDAARLAAEAVKPRAAGMGLVVAGTNAAYISSDLGPEAA